MTDEYDINNEFVSEPLGVTVRFHKPLRGKHWAAYEQVLRAHNGNVEDPDLAHRFAAALTIIDEWESDGRYPRPDKAGFDEGDYAFVSWVGDIAWTYVLRTRLVPFRLSLPSPDTPAETDQPPPN